MYEVFAPVIFAIAGIWVMAQGAIVNASAEVEGKSTPVWGVALNAFGGFTVVINLLLTVILLFGSGGEGGMIPESAWGVLTAAMTMIGASFASALCIMVAAKAGAEMLTERPELSIWSLLFVALGEGIAIYGLIVAILLSGG
ncbi:ATP synthase subunit C [Candidatus Bathyarchaeota archaeon]|nr:ATP synthase subunit C [Candidatus Bathyarchaeota archaeon]